MTSKEKFENKETSQKWVGIGGPQGYGDPDDTTLNFLERGVTIPAIKRRIIKEEKCAPIIKAYEECVVAAGLLLCPFKCKQLKLEMAECSEYWAESDELSAKAKKEFLEDRSEFRKTGVVKQNREYVRQLIKEKEKNGLNGES